MTYHFKRFPEKAMQLTDEHTPVEECFTTLTVQPYKQNDHHLVQKHHVDNMSDIDSLAMRYQDQYVTITNEQIMMLRAAYAFTLNRGDAFEMLLKRSLPEDCNVVESMYNEDRDTMYVFYMDKKFFTDTEEQANG